MEKIIELAKKLKALADKGVGGEKENAAEKLQALLQKHGLTIEDIEGEKVKEFTFHVTEEQRTFFYQILANVLGKTPDVKQWTKNPSAIGVKDKNWKNAKFIHVTPAEYIEIKEKFEFYYSEYRKEESIFYSAFIQKNALWRKSTGENSEKELTPEEKAELWKIFQYMETIERKTIQKKLN